MIDTAIIANLSNSFTFFASTTLLILGGLLAPARHDREGVCCRARAAVQPADLGGGVELKILLLVAIFVYAFFKFTWSMRQFNMASVLVGAAPGSRAMRRMRRTSSTGLAREPPRRRALQLRTARLLLRAGGDDLVPQRLAVHGYHHLSYSCSTGGSSAPRAESIKRPQDSPFRPL
jgi:hypothetical protein